MIRPRQGPAQEWAPPLVLAAMILLFYWRVLFDHQIFVFVDASRFFYPLWKWGSDALKQGFIPLWNPDAQFGAPYLADPQTAYAYPPVPLLYAFLSPLNAFAALIILHHFWALLGFWFFARHQGFSAKASLFGSLTFGFALHIVCSSWTPPALMAISWIPWVFMAVEKVRKSERGAFVFLSVAWAMQLAAGYPVLVYLTGLAVGFHLIWRTFWNEAPADKSSRRGAKEGPLKKAFHSWLPGCLGKVLAAGLLAVAYNLVWGLPFAELIGLSNYGNGPERFQDLGFLDLVTLISPFIQGHPLGSNYHGPHYWVSTYFFGRPALCLLLWGAFRKVFRKTPWGVFPLLLVLSVGSTLGLGSWLKSFLPGYSLVIHSGFWISLLVFWAAWMAAESSEALLEPKGRPQPVWLWPALVTGLYMASFLLKRPLPEGAFWLSFTALLFVGIVPSIPWRWGLLAAALALSLGTAASGINILLDKSYYEKPPEILSGMGRPGRLFFSPPLMKEAVHLQGASMAQAYDVAKQKMYPDWPLAFGREEIPLYNTLQLRSSSAWTSDAFRYSLRHSRKVLDYLDVRYIFGKTQFSDLKPGPSLKDEQGLPLMEVSENPTPLPKWFSVGKAVPAGDSLEEDFAKAASVRLDYSKVCFLDGISGAESYQDRQVEYLPLGPNRVELEAKGSGKALLVSSETAYPGWAARVNGQPRPVETLNHSFRGVQLNDGETRAAFSFEPATFRLGLFTTGLVCGFWMLLFLKDLFLSRAREE